MRLNIAVRTVRMVNLRTSYMMRDALCLMHRIQYGIRRTRHNPRCGREGRLRLLAAFSGFTMIELVIVVIIIAIAAMTAIPLITSADSFQIRSAANMIASDLEYAKTISISRGQSFSVVFDKSTESYSIKQEGSTEPIWHPVKKGFRYVINFASDSRLNRVDIVDAVFDATSEVKFDYLGSPYNGSNAPLNNGVITLEAGGITKWVHVEPVTGYISITD